jgi:carboxyl-terminal processing protease
MNSGYVYEYAIRYIDRNRAKLKTLKTWQQMVAYLENQPLVDNLVEFAFSKGVHRRPYLIEESYGLLNKQLIANVIRPFYGDDAFYQFVLKDDILVKKAVGMIQARKASTQAIVNHKYK